MNSISIDKCLNAHLGLPVDYQIDKSEAFKLYQYMHSISGIDAPINHGRLEFYIDKNGDFVNNPKNKRDRVVKAIHENMSMQDKFETLNYIEYWRETNGFKDLNNA